MKLRKRGFSGTLSPEISSREIRHRRIARRAAAEGIVLLENDGVLPLKAGQPVALYGSGARYTIKGGTGSGSVNNRSNVSIDEGLRNAGFVITTDSWLDDFDQRYQSAKAAWIQKIYDLAGTPGNFDALYRAHASNPMTAPAGLPVTAESKKADTAIYVISRVSGEGADRKTEEGDYYLTYDEREILTAITSVYEKTIVVLNIGGMIDLSFLDTCRVSALVYLSQAGMEGGNALADVLSGHVNPSGKLTDTWAFAYEDYPSSATFSHNNGNLIEEKYTEGIYVGYRYFDAFCVKPRYPFGYGLSYTTFTLNPEGASLDKNKIRAVIRVTNTGNVPGKEVVQLYAACPPGKQKKEQKRLVAFGKTKLLPPAASERIVLEFDLSLLESYHTGRAAYYMEKGNYYLLAGAASDQTQPLARLTLQETVQTEQLTNICPLLDALAEIAPDGESALAYHDTLASAWKISGTPSLILDGNIQIRTKNRPDPESDDADGILKQLGLSEKAALVCGRPRTGTAAIIGSAGVTVPGAAGETTPILLENYGVGNIILADGPAGIRLQAHYEENPADGSIYTMDPYQSLENRLFAKEFLHEGSVSHYQYCSAIPVGTLLAQSFDLELMQEIGEMIGRELEEFGITLWLAPGMNIHRNPLCGRNFEYYSEDPLVSGMMAAALTLGVQRIPGVGTTIKHFACNNQEENRRGVSSIVSERALREIYLKGFEIAVKASRPMSIMTSYNKVNGVHAANSRDLCTVAAREEWGFTGIIMTDWTTTNADGGSSAAKCVAAGNDLIMPGKMSDLAEIIDAVHREKDLSLDEQDLDACAGRILRVILASNIYEDAKSYLEGKELLPCMKQIR